MSSCVRLVARLALCPALVSMALLAASTPAAAQDNVVQIMIVSGEFKIVNRGVGLCKSPTTDCANEIVWLWTGGDPSSTETEKIVIEFVKGTTNAGSCFSQTKYEILERNTSVTAMVTSNCPDKSAWLYKISCVRTDSGNVGKQCTGIDPVDPGAVIG